MMNKEKIKKKPSKKVSSKDEEFEESKERLTKLIDLGIVPNKEIVNIMSKAIEQEVTNALKEERQKTAKAIFEDIEKFDCDVCPDYDKLNKKCCEKEMKQMQTFKKGFDNKDKIGDFN